MPTFNLKPTLSAYLRLAYPFGLVEQPDIPPAVLNWNIQWAFPLRKHRDDHAQFDFYPGLTMQHWAALGFLRRQDLTPELPRLLREGLLADTIFELLESGWCVRVFADYHFLDGTAFSGQGHFRHDFMVFAADAATRTFTGALYPTEEAFGTATARFERIAEAVASPHARGADCAPYCQGDSLTAFRAGPEEILRAPLHPADIREQIAGFLDSSNLSNLSFANQHLQRFCRAGAAHRRNAAFGLAAYTELRDYFARSVAEGVLPDRKVSRVLWEHKKLMKIRLDRLAVQGVPLPPEILDEWESIMLLAQGIHLKAVQARRLNSPAKLAFLNDDLTRIEAREAQILRRLVDAL